MLKKWNWISMVFTTGIVLFLTIGCSPFDLQKARQHIQADMQEVRPYVQAGMQKVSEYAQIGMQEVSAYAQAGVQEIGGYTQAAVSNAGERVRAAFRAVAAQPRMKSVLQRSREEEEISKVSAQDLSETVKKEDSSKTVKKEDSSETVKKETPSEAVKKEEKITEKDYQVLLNIVQAEAGGCDAIGKILVANVILNRVKSEMFPDTITDVVYEKSQFTPVINGSINQVKVSDSTKDCVLRALRGEDYSQGALYFMNRRSSQSGKTSWFDRKLTYLFQYEAHEFFR